MKFPCPRRFQFQKGLRSMKVPGQRRSQVRGGLRSRLYAWVCKRDVGRASQVLMLSVFLIAGDGVSAGHSLYIFLSLFLFFLSLSLSLSLLPSRSSSCHTRLPTHSHPYCALSLSMSSLFSHLVEYLFTLSSFPHAHHIHKLRSHFAFRFS